MVNHLLQLVMYFINIHVLYRLMLNEAIYGCIFLVENNSNGKHNNGWKLNERNDKWGRKEKKEKKRKRRDH